MQFTTGNIEVRSNVFERPGDQSQGHCHNFDHTSIVFTGKVRVKAEMPSGKIVEQDFIAPAHFLVKAGIQHSITAIHVSKDEALAQVDAMSPEDIRERLASFLSQASIVWCVFPHRAPSGEIIDQHIGWTPAYG